jgi:hypothetical protein
MGKITHGWMLAVLVVAAPAIAETGKGNPEASTKTAKPAKPDDQKVRCRSQLETGSLTRYRKTCMTIAEWRKYNDHGNRQARDLVAIGNACGGGAGCQQGN